MIIALGADHGGFYLKEVLAEHLRKLGHTVDDLGTHSEDAVDYPDYARAVTQAIRENKAERGILICGSGVGAGVAANKFPGIRAAVCHDTFSAHQGVEDDDMNVLCLGARVVGPELAKEIVRTYLSATFSGAERHVRRLGKIADIEKEFMPAIPVNERKEVTMKLGYIGLGKMGYNMVELLLDNKYEVVVYNRSEEPVKKIAQRGAQPAASLRTLVASLTPPRLVWIMVPYSAVDDMLKDLVPLLAKGDTVIDGGNSPYKESMRRAKELEGKGIDFLDAGVSGGPGGARAGACIMVGGKEAVFQMHEKLFRDLAVENGYAYLGGSGSGHFVKMVHNGIEYGMMQAIAEGFSVMKASPFKLDLKRVADLYNHRSVIESRLVGWLKSAYEQSGPELKDISGSVAQSGEGMWTVDAAKELGIPVPIIQGALGFRLQSQKNPSYIGKVVSALRHQFGGHEVKEKKKELI